MEVPKSNNESSNLDRKDTKGKVLVEKESSQLDDLLERLGKNFLQVKRPQRGGDGDTDRIQQKSWDQVRDTVNPDGKKDVPREGTILPYLELTIPSPCNVCQDPGLLRCAGCDSTWYCSLPHLQKDWTDHRKNCFPLTRVGQDTESKMLYLEASKDLRKGSIIVCERTYFTFADPSTGFGDDISDDVGMYTFTHSLPKKLICVGCFSKVEKIHVVYCPDCKSPVCKTKCAESGRHSDDLCVLLCKVTRTSTTPGKFLPKILEENPSGWQIFYDFIAVLKILLLKRDNRVCWLQFERLLFPIGDDQIRYGKNSHMAQQQQIILAYETLFRELSDIVGPEENVVEPCFRILNVLKRRGVAYNNDVEVDGPYQRSLSPKLAYIEHSCLPNVDISIKINGDVHVKALKEIKKGDKILAGFVNLLRPTYERQLLLQIQRYAQCSCLRCLDPSELGTYFGSLKCYSLQGCGGEGFFVLENPEDIIHFDKILVWKCQLCEFKTTHFYVVNRIQEAMKTLISDPRIDNWKINLECLEENIFGLLSKPNNFHKKHFLILKFYQKFACLFGCPIRQEWTNKLFQRKIYLCEEVSLLMEELGLEFSTLNAETTYNVISSFCLMDITYSTIAGSGLTSTYPKLLNMLACKLWNSLNHYDRETTFGQYATTAENIARSCHSSPGAYLSLENLISES